MSRKIIYSDSRITVISGIDHALGQFCQIYDKEFVNETSEGEGIVFEWSQLFGIETNLTGIPNTTSPEDIVKNYIFENTQILKSRLN